MDNDPLKNDIMMYLEILKDSKNMMKNSLGELQFKFQGDKYFTYNRVTNILTISALLEEKLKAHHLIKNQDIEKLFRLFEYSIKEIFGLTITVF